MRASEKSSISTNRKSTMRFPSSHKWTVYVTHKSPKSGIKRDFAVFASKNQIPSKKSQLQSLFVWKRPAVKL